MKPLDNQKLITFLDLLWENKIDIHYLNRDKEIEIGFIAQVGDTKMRITFNNASHNIITSFDVLDNKTPKHHSDVLASMESPLVEIKPFLDVIFKDYITRETFIDTKRHYFRDKAIPTDNNELIKDKDFLSFYEQVLHSSDYIKDYVKNNTVFIDKDNFHRATVQEGNKLHEIELSWLLDWQQKPSAVTPFKRIIFKANLDMGHEKMRIDIIIPGYDIENYIGLQHHVKSALPVISMEQLQEKMAHLPDIQHLMDYSVLHHDMPQNASNKKQRKI